MPDEWQLLVKAGISVEESLKIVMANPAKRVGLFGGKGSLEAGKDADLIVLDEELTLESVLPKGRSMIHRDKTLVKGTFEE